MPNFESLLKQSDDLLMMQKANIKALKRRFDVEKNMFSKASKQGMNNLLKEQRFTKLEDKQNATTKLREFLSKKNNEYNATEEKLNTLEKFYENQETLRRFTAASGGAGILQHILGYSGITPMFAGQFRAGAAAGFFALSPKITSPIIKSGLMAGGAINRGLSNATPILRESGIQQVLGTKILREE
jgi:hypothetical protein